MNALLTGFVDEIVKLAVASDFTPKAVPQTATGNERVSPKTQLAGGATGAYLKNVRPQRMESPPKAVRPRYRPGPRFKPTASKPVAPPPVKKRRIKRLKPKPAEQRERRAFQGGAAFLNQRVDRASTEHRKKLIKEKKIVSPNFAGRGGVMHVKREKGKQDVPVVAPTSREARAKRSKESASDKRIQDMTGPRKQQEREPGRITDSLYESTLGQFDGATRTPSKPKDRGTPKWQRAKKQKSNPKLLSAAGLTPAAAGQFTDAQLRARIKERKKAGLNTYGY